MNEYEAFVAAIRAHPDEDTPRLALADWLQENGDETRAEFVRAQVALGAAQPDEAFRQRWKEHTDRWRAELPKLSRVTWGAMLRGFVDSVVTTPAAFVEHAAAIARAAPVTAVTFYSPPGFANLAAVPEMADVHTIRFSFRQQLTDSQLCPVLGSPYCPRLRALDVGQQLLTARSMLALADCPRMDELSELKVDHNRIQDDGLRALARSPHLTGLRKLVAFNNALTDGGVAAVAASATLAGLTQLKLGGAIGAAGVRALADSPHLTRLRSLELVDYAAGAEGARALAASANLWQLEALALSGRADREGAIGAAGARALADSPHLRLRALTLFRMAIGDTGARALAASPNMSRLRLLHLGGNDLTNAAAAALAGSPHLNALPPGGLRVDGNALTNDGLQALRERFERA